MKKKTKILITNAWSDLNRGDSAILLGMISFLKRHFPLSSINIMSEFDENDPNFASGYQVVTAHYPEVTILPALFPYPSGNKLSKRVKWLLHLGRALCTLLFPFLSGLFFSKKRALSWQRLKESDLVISKGGHIFHSANPSLRHLLGILKHFYPLLLGIRLRKKTILYAQSFGPFSGRINRRFAKWFFNSIGGLSAREKISIQILRDLGVKKAITLVPDAAFYLSPVVVANLKVCPLHQMNRGERMVIFTPRQWKTAGVIECLADVASWINKELGYQVVLVAHTIGPTPEEDDRMAVKALYELLPEKSRVKTIDTTDLDTIQVMGLYTDASLLIGTRLHSVIFALLNLVPAIAISYFGPKTRGGMEELGLSDFVVDINKISAQELKQKVRTILTRESEIKKHLRLKLAELQNQAEENGLKLIKSVIS
ncbi:MAG: polysaccharide pyruvyl transferase family protein [candidate division WOR-3 bacterium]